MKNKSKDIGLLSNSYHKPRWFQFQLKSLILLLSITSLACLYFVGWENVSVPIDGEIVDIRVQQGDMVTEGQVLATLRNRDIELELAMLRASPPSAQNSAALARLHRAADALIVRSPVSGEFTTDTECLALLPVSRGQQAFTVRRPLVNQWVFIVGVAACVAIAALMLLRGTRSDFNRSSTTVPAP